MYYNTYERAPDKGERRPLCYNFPNMPRKFVYLLGNPVGHSISPHIHNAAYKKLGINFEYIARQIKEDDLKKAVESIKLPDVAGANVTVPYKEKIMHFLDEIDEQAKLIGAVNTVVNKNGRLSGSNTDYLGFIDSLENDGGIRPSGKKVLILGAGGAARAVAVGLCQNAVASVFIFDVESKKAEKLSNDLKKNFKTSVNTVRLGEELQELINNMDILVNSTPIGMFPAEEFSPIDEDVKIPAKLFVYDLVYNPSQTHLVKRAKASGSKAVTGLGMLVRQGAASFKLFTGHDAPVDVMMKAAQKALGM